MPAEASARLRHSKRLFSASSKVFRHSSGNSAEFNMRSIDQIQFISRIAPERIAVVAGTSIVTYGMLEQATRQVMARIAQLGLSPGSLVGVAIKAPARHLAVTLGLARLGLVSAPVGNDQILAVLPPLDLMLADQPMLVGQGRLCLVVDESWFAGDLPMPPAVSRADSDLFRIVTSSGTTGVPKPLIHSYLTLEQQLVASRYSFDMAHSQKRALFMLDLSTNWSLMSAMGALSRGRSLYFSANPREALTMLALYDCDLLLGSVFHLDLLVKEQRLKRVELPSLGTIVTGGSLIGPELAEAIHALLCRNVLLHYGSSELGLTALAMTSDADLEGGELGAILPWNEVEVVDEKRRPLPDGEVGELRIRAEGQVTNLPRDNGDVGLPWFYPGDVGYRTPDGRLFLTGRIGDLINVGGGKIAPERVERMLRRHPKVRDAGVCGFGSGLERIRAAVVVEDGFVMAELEAHCAREFTIAPIERITTVGEIRRVTSGKIDRLALRQSLT